jgi:hypothetical protein
MGQNNPCGRCGREARIDGTSWSAGRPAGGAPYGVPRSAASGRARLRVRKRAS